MFFKRRYLFFIFVVKGRDFTTTPFLSVLPLKLTLFPYTNSLSQKKKGKKNKEKDYVEVTTPFTTGSLLRYVAQ